MNSRSVYIVLSMSGTKFAKFLKHMRPEMAYPHVSISLDPELKTLYSFARQYYYFPIIAGFVEEHPNSGVFGRFPASCQVLEVKVNEEQYHNIIRLIEYMKTNSKKYSYNFSGLVFTYFNLPRKLKHKFTCTQFVAWILNNSEIKIVDKPISLITSVDYLKMPNSHVIYRGLLNDYKFSEIYA